LMGQERIGIFLTGDAHLGHADTTVGEGDGVVGLVGGDVDEQFRLALEHCRWVIRDGLTVGLTREVVRGNVHQCMFALTSLVGEALVPAKNKTHQDLESNGNKYAPETDKQHIPDLVESIRGIADQLAEEDLFVAVLRARRRRKGRNKAMKERRVGGWVQKLEKRGRRGTLAKHRRPTHYLRRC